MRNSVAGKLPTACASCGAGPLHAQPQHRKRCHLPTGTRSTAANTGSGPARAAWKWRGRACGRIAPTRCRQAAYKCEAASACTGLEERIISTRFWLLADAAFCLIKLCWRQRFGQRVGHLMQVFGVVRLAWRVGLEARSYTASVAHRHTMTSFVFHWWQAEKCGADGAQSHGIGAPPAVQSHPRPPSIPGRILQLLQVCLLPLTRPPAC